MHIHMRKHVHLDMCVAPAFSRTAAISGWPFSLTLERGDTEKSIPNGLPIRPVFGLVLAFSYLALEFLKAYDAGE